MKFLMFLLVAFFGILLNRTFAWRRRADASHRERFRKLGWEENFPSYRLRRDGYVRIALIAWAVFSALPILAEPTRRGHFHVPLWLGLLEVLGSMVCAVIPAGFIWFVVSQYKEATLPNGMRAAVMMTKEFHRPVKPLVAGQSHGSAKIADLEQIGLINLQGMQTRGYRPIVPEEQR